MITIAVQATPRIMEVETGRLAIVTMATVVEVQLRVSSGYQGHQVGVAGHGPLVMGTGGLHLLPWRKRQLIGGMLGTTHPLQVV